MTSSSPHAQHPEQSAWRRICAVLLLAAIASPATAQLHAARFSSSDPASKSLSDYGIALAVYEEDLVVGGLFSSAGGLQTGFGSARFNGAAWGPLVPAARFGGPVETFLVSGGDLIVGGIADSVGNLPVTSIARWDGADWHALGGLLPEQGQPFVIVNALAMYEGKLIVGGTFTTAGSPPARNIASWDGTQWSALGAGHNNPVKRLFVHEGRLFATPRSASARVWDGSTWQAVPGGPNDLPLEFHVFEGALIAGGEFRDSNGNLPWKMARWTGAVWERYPPTPGNCFPRDLETFRGELVVLCARSVFALRAGNWELLGTANDDTLEKLVVYNERLVLTGLLSAIDGISVQNIASWDGQSWSAAMPRDIPIFSGGFEP